MEQITIDLARKLGEKIGIDWDKVKFDPEALAAGIKVELEHGTKDPQTNVTDNDLTDTAKIALAHLKEFADYYKRLKEMEMKKSMRIWPLKTARFLKK